jgi:hypothetical protein
VTNKKGERKNAYLYQAAEHRLKTLMEILEGDALQRLLFQRYSKKPDGWSLTFSKSSSYGFFDALVTSPDESWQLKLDTIFKPWPLVIGATIEVDQSKLKPLSPFSFGFRNLGDQEDASALLEAPSGDIEKLLALLASRRPVAPTPGGNYIQGPFVFAERGVIPGQQKTDPQKGMDERLSQELLNAVRRKYPSYL